MDLAGVALLDDLLPFSGQQLTKIAKYRGVTNRILQSAAFEWYPSDGNRPGSVNVGLQVEWHDALGLGQSHELLLVVDSLSVKQSSLLSTSDRLFQTRLLQRPASAA